MALEEEAVAVAAEEAVDVAAVMEAAAATAAGVEAAAAASRNRRCGCLYVRRDAPVGGPDDGVIVHAALRRYPPLRCSTLRVDEDGEQRAQVFAREQRPRG